jgi:hypothetical protein
MFETTNLKVFLGSPWDVKADRDIAVAVLKRIAEAPAYRGRVTMQVFTYDDPNAPTAMPANVNPELGIIKYGGRPSRHHFTVIILWSRMGTRMPPALRRPDGRAYESGTEWEFEDARRAGKDVFVYRRTDPPPAATAEPGEAREQLQKLERFVGGFRNPDGSLEGFVHEYRDPPGLEDLFDKHMQGVVRSWLERAERRWQRIRLGVLAALAFAVTAAVTTKAIQKVQAARQRSVDAEKLAKAAQLPRIDFKRAANCVFVQQKDERRGFLEVDYEVVNARARNSIYLALYDKQGSSPPVVKRPLSASPPAPSEIVDFAIDRHAGTPRWARIEIEGGPDASAVSRAIDIECRSGH